MKSAFAYIRVSSKQQAEEGRDGFPRQREAITAYAKTHGIRIVNWFEEPVSGTKSEFDRLAWRDMEVALQSNGVKLVIIERLDRLARDLMVQETLIGGLRQKEFELVSTAEPDLCSDDPTRTLIRQVFGAFAQYERAMLVAKLMAARIRKRAAQGWCEGRKPFGARPGEDKAIARMRQLQREGLNFRAIARALNAEAIRTRTRGLWHGVSVKRILLGLKQKNPASA